MGAFDGGAAEGIAADVHAAVGNTYLLKRGAVFEGAAADDLNALDALDRGERGSRRLASFTR